VKAQQENVMQRAQIKKQRNKTKKQNKYKKQKAGKKVKTKKSQTIPKAKSKKKVKGKKAKRKEVKSGIEEKKERKEERREEERQERIDDAQVEREMRIMSKRIKAISLKVPNSTEAYQPSGTGFGLGWYDLPSSSDFGNSDFVLSASRLDINPTNLPYTTSSLAESPKTASNTFAYPDPTFQSPISLPTLSYPPLVVSSSSSFSSSSSSSGILMVVNIFFLFFFFSFFSSSLLRYLDNGSNYLSW